MPRPVHTKHKRKVGKHHSKTPLSGSTLDTVNLQREVESANASPYIGGPRVEVDGHKKKKKGV